LRTTNVPGEINLQLQHSSSPMLSKRLLVQLKRPLTASCLRAESAFENAFERSSGFENKGAQVTDFVAKLNPESRLALENELRRLREDSDESNETGLVPVKPSSKECRICFVHNAVPFVGFGFLDNVVMIVAGDYIDSTLGVAFNISVLAAAGLGNTLSDVVGIFFGGYIELVADRMGLPKPNFTAAEADHMNARVAKNGGQAFGIVFGCLLGMFPLLFIDNERAPKVVCF